MTDASMVAPPAGRSLGRVFQVAALTLSELRRGPLLPAIGLGSAGLIAAARPLALFAFGREDAMAREVAFAAVGLGGALVAVFGLMATFGADRGSGALRPYLSLPIRRVEWLAGRGLGVSAAAALITLALAALTALILGEAGASSAGSLRTALYALLPIPPIVALGLVCQMAARGPGAAALHIIAVMGAWVLPPLLRASDESRPLLAAGATLLPDLAVFDAALIFAEGGGPPFSVLLSSGVHALCYTAFALLVAGALFEAEELPA